MNDTLHLPSKYKVDKIMDSSFFVENANLTKAERKELEPYLSHVAILYQVEYEDDSQLIFLEIVIGCIYYEHTFQKVARAVASSLPHQVILLIRYQNRTKIVAFNSRANTKNSFRRYVQNFVCSPYFWSNRLNGIDRSSIQRIESAVIHSKSAAECNRRIINVLRDWKEDHFDERMENKRGLYTEDKIAQLDLLYEFEQEDKEQQYDTDYFIAPVDGYESMSFEEKNYMYFFNMRDSKDDE